MPRSSQCRRFIFLVVVVTSLLPTDCLLIGTHVTSSQIFLGLLRFDKRIRGTLFWNRPRSFFLSVAAHRLFRRLVSDFSPRRPDFYSRAVSMDKVALFCSIVIITQSMLSARIHLTSTLSCVDTVKTSLNLPQK